jgi:hypothetical protein
MAFKQRSSGSFKMMGSSPAKAVGTDNETKRTNLLKAVPNEAAYNKLSYDNKKGFDAAGKKAGLPQKKSPAKAKTNPKISLGMGKEADANLSKKVNTTQTTTPKGFNTKGGKTTTPGYNTTKAANKGLPKGFNTTGTSKAGKFAKVAKKVVGKAGKFLGGKTLGVAGMLMATSSKADQPTKGKGKREYEGGKIDFTKKKSGLPQKPSPAKIDPIEGTAVETITEGLQEEVTQKKKANQTSPKKAKTSLRSKAKSAWYTMMHHDGGKSSDGQQWKTYKEKKKEFRDNNKGKKAGKPDKDVSWKSGY